MIGYKCCDTFERDIIRSWSYENRGGFVYKIGVEKKITEYQTPMLVFKTLKQAKTFVTQHSWVGCDVAIFKCDYTPSDIKPEEFLLTVDEVPDGTVCASSVTLIGENLLEV